MTPCPRAFASTAETPPAYFPASKSGNVKWQCVSITVEDRQNPSMKVHRTPYAVILALRYTGMFATGSTFLGV
jgi:hypothetical protein